MFWYEVWADEGLSPPYILMLVFDGAKYCVIDVKEGKDNVHSSESYEEAVCWLTEDEYTRVTGRMEVD